MRYLNKQDSRVKRTVINTITGIGSQVVKLLLSFAMRSIFIYTLGIQYVGVSSVFTDLLTMLSFTELGIGTAIATALYRPIHDNDTVQIRKLMKFYQQAYRLIALVVVLIGVILLPFLDRIITNVPNIHEDIRLIFGLYIAKTAVSYLLIYRSTMFSADQRQSVVNLVTLASSVLRYVLEIVMLLVFHQFIAYLLIEVIATIAQNIWISVKAKKEYGFAFEKTTDKLSKKQVLSLLRDIKGLAMYQFSGSIGNSINSVLVSGLISTVTAGLMANYTMIQKQIETVVRQFFNAVVPSIGNLVADRNPERQFSVFNRVFYFSFVLINFCSASLYILIGPFISIWLGHKYVLGMSISFVISFDFFLYILLQAIAAFRTANGLFVRGQYRPLVTTIMNIFLTYFMVQWKGIFGAILATIICRILTLWYDPFLLYKLIFKKPFRRFLIKYFYYTCIFLGSLFLTEFCTKVFQVNSSIVNFLIDILFCLLVPNILIIITTFKTSEFAYFKGYILKIAKGRIKNEKI